MAKSATEKKTYVIRARATQSEGRDIERMAILLNMTVSDVIREAVRRGLRSMRPKPVAPIRLKKSA